MQRHNSSYPIRIVSRKAAKKRFRRVSWLVLGAGFGFGCTMAMSPALLSPLIMQFEQGPQLFASAPEANQAYETPVSGGIDVVASAIRSPEKKNDGKQEIADAYPLSLQLKVENGDTLMTILTDAGVSYDEAQNAVRSIRSEYNPKKLDIGQNVALVLDKKQGTNDSPFIASMTIPVSPTSQVELTRQSNASKGTIFAIKKIDAPIERKLAHAGGRIDSSLYETGVSAGIPAGLISELISAYSYDVDFQREIQPGDAMDVLYERLQTRSGVNAGHGNLLFAQLNLGDRVMKIYRYVDANGTADFYNEKGESIRKALLRTPINGARITSGYGMRNHPLLGYTKMHRGVDFGAPTGTPIYAAGDGSVDFVGRKGGYGNYLRIKHTDKYASAYAHISRFAAGIAPGHKVKQGQIIAYVGATGMATGPHLHYEILVNNEQINPASMKFKTGNVLQGKELTAFRKSMEQIHASLANIPRKTDVAMVDELLASN